MDLQWNSDAFLQLPEDSENKHYYVSSPKKAKEKLLADFPRKLELGAEKWPVGDLVQALKTCCHPLGSQRGKSDQLSPGPVELVAAALELG